MLLGFVLLAIPSFSGNGIIPSFRQLSLIGFNLIFSFLLLNAYKNDFLALFKDYIDLIYIAAIVGIIQIFSQMVGFTYGADFSYLGFDMQHFRMSNWRIQGWFQEPAFLAIAFTPVVFVGVCSLFNLTDMISKQKAIIIMTVLILSQSTIGLIGLLLSLMIVVFNKYSLVKSPLLLAGSFFLLMVVSLVFYAIPQVRLRIDDTFHLFTTDRITPKDIENANLSTYSTFSNYKVAMATLKDNPIFGSGLGTYEYDYFRYINVVLPENRITQQYALNERDANSMLLRITAELGLLGLGLLFWFIWTNRINIDFISATREQVNYWIINSAALSLFLIRLFRQGHYTMLGFMLFILIYYCSKQEFKRSYENQAMLNDRKSE
ncbi:MAG: O-antigen ligase family protein [Chryseolinea sp.]